MIKPVIIALGSLLLPGVYSIHLAAAVVEVQAIEVNSIDENEMEATAIAILSRVETPSSTVIPFVELRKNALLEQPMVLSGEIYFPAPGTLSKHITSPFEERVTISSIAVEIEKNGENRRLPLKRKKGLLEFYTGLNALLEKDLVTLMALFDVESLSGGETWSIVLVPADARLEKSLERMIISGADSRVTGVRTVQSDTVWQELSFGTPDSG